MWGSKGICQLGGEQFDKFWGRECRQGRAKYVWRGQICVFQFSFRFNPNVFRSLMLMHGTNKRLAAWDRYVSLIFGGQRRSRCRCCSFGQEYVSNVSNESENYWWRFIDNWLRMMYSIPISISLCEGGAEKGNFRCFNVTFDDRKWPFVIATSRD